MCSSDLWVLVGPGHSRSTSRDPYFRASLARPYFKARLLQSTCFKVPLLQCTPALSPLQTILKYLKPSRSLLQSTPTLNLPQSTQKYLKVNCFEVPLTGQNTHEIAPNLYNSSSCRWTFRAIHVSEWDRNARILGARVRQVDHRTGPVNELQETPECDLKKLDYNDY